MGYESDKRFSPQNFAAKEGRASAPPRCVVAEGAGGGATEASREAHAASDQKMQYQHPVRPEKSPTGRFE
jgi:hypothetical protein